MPFVAIFAWLAAFFGKDVKNLGFNLAKFSAYVAFVVFSLGLLVAGTLTILDGIKVSVPTVVNQVWGWVMPDNAVACLLAIVSARFLRVIYDFKIQLASKKLQMLKS